MENNLADSIDKNENEGHLFEPRPEYKLYNDHAIAIGTFIGGPLVAAYLMSFNFKTLGQGAMVPRTWLIAIGTCVVVFLASFYLPVMEQVPTFLIPLIYTAIAQALYKKFQGEAVKKHVLAEGGLYSAGRGALFGLVGLVIFIGLFLLILWLVEGVTIFDLIELAR